MKRIQFIMMGIAGILLLAGCPSPTDPADSGGNGGTVDSVIDIAAIPGVTAPAGGATPVTTITETDQYTGTVSWDPADNPFDYETVYTATITLTAKSGYTLTGVTADFFTLAGATTDTNDADSGVVTAVFPETDQVFAIGDTGPAGGLIFYIDTADAHSWTYLEVAPASTEWTSKEWGNSGTEIGGDAALTGIGDGQAATAAIVAHMEGQSITGTAAQLCDGLSEGGYNDWFLPSKDELNAIWDNLVDDGSGSNSGVGGFDPSGIYWSSSEFSSNNAWYQYFAIGAQSNYSKTNPTRVRAVRAF
jgi:hypothetical protein